MEPTEINRFNHHRRQQYRFQKWRKPKRWWWRRSTPTANWPASWSAAGCQTAATAAPSSAAGSAAPDSTGPCAAHGVDPAPPTSAKFEKIDRQFQFRKQNQFTVGCGFPQLRGEGSCGIFGGSYCQILDTDPSKDSLNGLKDSLVKYLRIFETFEGSWTVKNPSTHLRRISFRILSNFGDILKILGG